MSSNGYQSFIANKTHLAPKSGFKPLWIPDFLFDFQKYLVEWSIERGRSANFADCGLGKSLMELVWAENVVRHTNGRVLLLTPLAVGHQMVAEGNKFGIECERSIDGKLVGKIIVTNYERLHYFNYNDFTGVICDESSILKNFDGATRQAVTNFMIKTPYRLLATATAAPNDFMELGTHSQALGHMGFIDMQNRFFVNDKKNASNGRYYGKKVEWRFRGHAETSFWRWVSSWGRAIRKPSDYGFDDGRFILPRLMENEHSIEVKEKAPGMLFNLPVTGWREQRAEKKRTIKDRCHKVAELVNDTGKASLSWCHLDAEADLLEKMIDGGVQISGRDSDEAKEERFIAFINGEILHLITKPKIGAWGLNLQHCAHCTYFPDHSYERYYQGVRRHWRFGQKNDVVVDVVTTEGEKMIMANVKRKADQADKMFTALVSEMNNAITIEREEYFVNEMRVPEWL